VAGLLTSARAGAPAADRARLDAAGQALDGYRQAHARIRTTDQHSNLIGAIQQASGSAPGDLPAAAATLDASLTAGITTSQQAFGADMAAADRALVPLMVLLVPLLVVVAVLVVVGMRRRIDEYR